MVPCTSPVCPGSASHQRSLPPTNLPRNRLTHDSKGDPPLRSGPFLALILVLRALPIFAQSPDQDLAAELRRRDVALLNAVHRGDRKLWESSTTPDFLYIEDGEITPRAELLKELEEDGSAPLIIRTFSVHRIGDTATVLHQDDVPARPLRDTANSHFLMAETWQRLDGQWKLRLETIYRLRVDPPAILLSPAQIDQLVGTYTSGSRTLTIRREGTRILAGRSGEPAVEWKAETRDVLFLPSESRSRKIFERNAAGDVTGFEDRDEASQVLWTRKPSPPH